MASNYYIIMLHLHHDHTSCRIIYYCRSYIIVSYRIVSHRIASHRIASYRIVESHSIVSNSHHAVTKLYFAVLYSNDSTILCRVVLLRKVLSCIFPCQDHVVSSHRLAPCRLARSIVSWASRVSADAPAPFERAKQVGENIQINSNKQTNSHNHTNIHTTHNSYKRAILCNGLHRGFSMFFLTQLGNSFFAAQFCQIKHRCLCCIHS